MQSPLALRPPKSTDRTWEKLLQHFVAQKKPHSLHGGWGAVIQDSMRMKNEIYAYPNLARILFLIQKSRKSETYTKYDGGTTVFVEKGQVLKQSKRKQRLSWSASCRPERPPSTCHQGLSPCLVALQVNNPI